MTLVALIHSGSADKTVKFWDLETFELIGSSGPEVYVCFDIFVKIMHPVQFNFDMHFM
jgi:WD40 repeat protein